MSNELRRLNRVPYGTPQHQKLVKKLQSTLTYNDYILCMKGKYDSSRVLEADVNINLNRATTQTKQAVLPSTSGTVYNDERFYFINRNEAEYNLEHRQVNVGLLITDRLGRVLVLRKSNGHASIVGGHTDFNKNTYVESVSQLMYYNLCKEYGEEVKAKEELVLPKTPSFFITEGNSIWDFFHCWYVYVVEIDNLDKFDFKSNEKHKHTTEISFISEIIDDPFTKTSLNGALKLYMSSLNSALHFKLKEDPIMKFQNEMRESLLNIIDDLEASENVKEQIKSKVDVYIERAAKKFPIDEEAFTAYVEALMKYDAHSSGVDKSTIFALNRVYEIATAKV